MCRKSPAAQWVNWRKRYRLYREKTKTFRKRGGRKRVIGTRAPMAIPPMPNQKSRWIPCHIRWPMVAGSASAARSTPPIITVYTRASKVPACRKITYGQKRTSPRTERTHIRRLQAAQVTEWRQYSHCGHPHMWSFRWLPHPVAVHSDPKPLMRPVWHAIDGIQPGQVGSRKTAKSRFHPGRWRARTGLRDVSFRQAAMHRVRWPRSVRRHR